MASWNSVDGGSEAFVSAYLSKTATPAHKRNTNSVPDIIFSPSTPSPTKHNGSPLMLPSSTESEAFCRQENLDQCISYLNQELTVLGYPSLYSAHGRSFDLKQFVNICYDLLRKHQHSSMRKEEMENLQHRTASDLTNLHHSYSRLQNSFEQCQRDLHQSEECVRQLQEQKKLMETKLKAEKDEVKRLQLLIKRKESQYNHELKKKEVKEVQRLKEKVNELLKDRKERRIGMEVLNAVPTLDGKRAKWASPVVHSRKVEEMYKIIVHSYAEKQKILMVENSELRDCLKDLQKNMVQLLTEPSSPARSNKSEVTSPESNDLDTDEESSTASAAHSKLSEGHFQMPFDTAKANIVRSINHTLNMVKQQLKTDVEDTTGLVDDKVQDDSDDDKGYSPKERHDRNREERHKKEVDKLTKQIMRLREIMEQQDKYIQENMTPKTPQASMNNSLLNTSELLQEKESLAGEKQLFYQQKANFEEERRLFTEAAIRLGKEKRAFEEEKAALLQKQFMKLSPFSSPESLSPRGEAKLRESQPVFSPAPRRLPKTPTTAELYKKLGLRVHDLDMSSTKDESSPTHPSSIEVQNMSAVSHHSAPSSTATFTQSSSNLSSPSNARIMQHLEGIKTVLFKKSKHMEGGHDQGDF